MDSTQPTLITIQIPVRLYAQLQLLAETQHTDLVSIIESSMARTLESLSTDKLQRQRVDEILLAAGLCRPTPLLVSTERPLSGEERDELAHRVGSTGRPLSEIILAEREEQDG